METIARKLGIALVVPMLAFALLSMGCYCADGFEQYTEDLTNASIGAGTPTLVPLTVSVPSAGETGANIGIEVHVDDCRAGDFELTARLMRADGTTEAATATDIFPRGLGATTSIPLACPGAPARFALAPSALTCADGRCTADLRVELSSASGVGPREIEVRLVKFEPTSCRHGETLRTDGRIDVWGN